MSYVDEREEFVPTERVAYITYLLCEGKTLTTAEVAAKLGITNEGARQLLNKVSRVVPLRQDLGYWFIVRT